ncbi:MAG TPA: YdeI/OmpD-associated family protein [Opitutaceae bacterium]|nr:YdeI/OmpD-associated family protein [Opitutaceae bacterium]
MKPVTFTARIEKIGVLRCVVVPARLTRALGGAARIPVIARYGGEITRSTLVPAGGERRRLVLQMRVLRPMRLDAGDRVEIGLERTAGSHKGPLPPDLQRALQFRPAAAEALDRASPSTWRIIMELLEQSRTPETRQRRIEKLVERLAENTPARATKI